MSRFSKADAEKAGWSFTHESDEVVLRDANEQGVTKVVPARVTAEKFLSLPGRADHTITETAETIGLLLERIHAFEQHLAGREEFQVEPLVGLQNELDADTRRSTAPPEKPKKARKSRKAKKAAK